MRLVGATASADPLLTVAHHLRDAFSLDSVAVLSKTADGWRTEASSGIDPPADPSEADETIDLSDDVFLVLRGPGSRQRIATSCTLSPTSWAASECGRVAKQPSTRDGRAWCRLPPSSSRDVDR